MACWRLCSSPCWAAGRFVGTLTPDPDDDFLFLLVNSPVRQRCSPTIQNTKKKFSGQTRGFSRWCTSKPINRSNDRSSTASDDSDGGDDDQRGGRSKVRSVGRRNSHRAATHPRHGRSNGNTHAEVLTVSKSRHVVSTIQYMWFL